MVVDVGPAAARAAWAALAATFGTRVVAKRTSAMMQWAAVGLALARVQRRSQFLDEFTTVIGRTIYAPADLAAGPPPGREFEWIALAVHEHVHVVQWRRDGGLRFALGYLLSPTRRAAYEVEAYATVFALADAFGRERPRTDDLVDSLRHYGLGARALAQAHSALERAAATGVVSPPVAIAVAAVAGLAAEETG